MATSGHGIKILNSVSKTHPESSVAKSYIKTLTWPQGLHTDTSNNTNYLQTSSQRANVSYNESNFKKTKKEDVPTKSYFTSLVNKSLDLFYQIPSLNKLTGVSYEAITNLHADWQRSSSQIQASVPVNEPSSLIPADSSTNDIKDVHSISSRSSVSCEVLKITKTVLQHYNTDKKIRSKSIGCLPDKKIYLCNTQTNAKTNGTESKSHKNGQPHKILRNVQSQQLNLSGSLEKPRNNHDCHPITGKSNNSIPKCSSSINEMLPLYSLKFGLMSTVKNYFSQKLPYVIRNCSTQGYTGKRNEAHSKIPPQNNTTRHYTSQLRAPADKWISSSKNLLKHIKRHVRDKNQKHPSIRQNPYQTTNHKSLFDDIKPLLLVLANAKQMAFEMKRLSKPKSSSENNQLLNPMAVKKSGYIDHSTLKRDVNFKIRNRKSKSPSRLLNMQNEHCNKINNTKMIVEPNELYQNKYSYPKHNKNVDELKNYESLKMTNFRYPPLKLKQPKTSRNIPVNENLNTNSNTKVEIKNEKSDTPKIKYQSINEKIKREHPTFLKKQDDKDLNSNLSGELSSRVKKDAIISENNRPDNNKESNESNNEIKESVEKHKEKHRSIKNYLKVTPPANREIDLWLRKKTKSSPTDAIGISLNQNYTYNSQKKGKYWDKNDLQTTYQISKEKENYVNSLKKPKKGVTRLTLFTSQREDTQMPDRITLESLLQSQLKKDKSGYTNNVSSELTTSARKYDTFNQLIDSRLGTSFPTLKSDGNGNRFKDYFQGRLSSFESNKASVMTNTFYQTEKKTKGLLQVDKTSLTKQSKVPGTSQMDNQKDPINNKGPSETLTDPNNKIKSKEDIEVKKVMVKHFLGQMEPKSLNIKNKLNYYDPLAVETHEGRNYLDDRLNQIDSVKSDTETSLNLSKFYLEKPGKNINRRFQFYSSIEDMQSSIKSISKDSFVSATGTSDKEIKKTKGKDLLVQNREPENKEFSTYEEILQRNQAIRNKLIKNRSYMSTVKKLEQKETVPVKSQSFMEYFMNEFNKKCEWIKEKETNNLKEVQKSGNRKLAFHEPKNKLQPSELTLKLKNHSSIPEIRNDVIVHRFSNRINKNKWRYQNQDHSNYWRDSEDKRKFLHNNLLQPNSKRFPQKNSSSQETDKVSNVESEIVFKNDNRKFNEEKFENENKGLLRYGESDSYFKNRYNARTSPPDRKSMKSLMTDQAMSNDWPTNEYTIETPKLSSHDLDVNSPTAMNGSWFSDTSYIDPLMKSVRVSLRPNNERKL